jgi:hypothetical protein
MSASAPVSSSAAAPSRGGVSGSDGSSELKLVHLQNLHDRQIQSLESAVQRLTDDNRSQSKVIERLIGTAGNGFARVLCRTVRPAL